MDKAVGFLLSLFLQILFRACFLLQVKGKVNLPGKGPYIIYANHSSYLDGFIIAASLPLKLVFNTYFLGFKGYILNPIVKPVVKLARLVPLDTTSDLVEVMQACSYLLKHSKIICFFPEGHRSASGEVMQFKKGIGILTKELDVALAPVYIEGAFRAWPRYVWFPRPAKIKVTFGKKLYPRDLLPKTLDKGDVYELFAESLRQELIKIKDLPAKPPV